MCNQVGELVGARLISHAGSLVNLAKHPASTVQILGAEKALFRALKTKQATPKYGLIYHAHAVGQSAPKLKGRRSFLRLAFFDEAFCLVPLLGKASRILAAKLALCSRVDALGEQTEATVAIESKRYVDRRLEDLQDNAVRGITRSFQRPALQKYQPNHASKANGYDAGVDVLLKKRKKDESNVTSSNFKKVKEE